MKNIFRKTIACLSIVCLVFVLSSSVKADSAPSSITVKRADVLNDIVTNHDHGFTVFTTTDGKIVYCMDVDKKALTTGQVASLTGNSDAGLLYILRNGYPNKQITGNDNIDKYITQAAVWWYLDENKLSNEFKNAGKGQDIYSVIPNYIKPMVSAARTATDNQPTPSMTTHINSTKLSLTNDSKYYESEYMSATVVGTSTYNVSVINGTKNTQIINESGSVVSSLKSDEKFKVRVPASEVKTKLNVEIKFYANGSVQKAKIYSTGDSNYQRVVGLYDEVTPLSENTTLTVIPESKTCVYIDGKYYGKSGKEVSKKTFEKECNPSCAYINNVYYGKDGNVVDKSTYDSECGQSIVVPNTKADINTAFILFGALLVFVGANVLILRKKQLM